MSKIRSETRFSIINWFDVDASALLIFEIKGVNIKLFSDGSIEQKNSVKCFVWNAVTAKNCLHAPVLPTPSVMQCRKFLLYEAVAFIDRQHQQGWTKLGGQEMRFSVIKYFGVNASKLLVLLVSDFKGINVWLFNDCSIERKVVLSASSEIRRQSGISYTHQFFPNPQCRMID